MRNPSDWAEAALAHNVSDSSAVSSDINSSRSVASPVRRLKASQSVPECMPS